MPHVIVKLWPGKSQQQKTRLAEAITKDYKPDMKHNWDKGDKKPGYDENGL